MQYKIQQISEIVGGEFFHAVHSDDIIEHILTDSRQVTFPRSSLFVALEGRQWDGHDFLEELQNAGVHNFLVSKRPSAERQHLSSNFIVVDDPLIALQALAAHHRRQFDIPVIGVTGSNGKTVVKEWLFQLLREDHHIVRSPKSFNSQLGVSLSILQMKPAHELAIIEAGISQSGEMEKLAKIIAPTIGVFTNLGEAHSKGFSSMDEKLQEKFRLFDDCEVMISPQSIVRSRQAIAEGQQLYTWSSSGAEADLSVAKIEISNKQAIIEADCGLQADVRKISIPFTDSASIENALTCWSLMLHLGYPHHVIAERMAKLEPVAMRLELKEAVNGCTVVNDSYNSDLTSLQIALEFLRQQAKNSHRTVVLSDILQSGQSPSLLYSSVAKLLLENNVDRLIGIGHDVRVLEALLPQKVEKIFFANTTELLSAYPDLSFKNETILLKGARDFGFEQIASRLAMKVHQTTLEVNLTALLNNLRVFQSHLLPGTQLMAMVKASAYGSGSVEVAKLLEFQHVDYLAVAYADEGVELRNAGIRLPIVVLNPEEATFDSLLRYQLEPEIYSLKLLENFCRSLLAPASIHLKLDTGMHRLGFGENDIEELVELIQQSATKGQQLTIKSIFTHLAASESPAHDSFTGQQIERFNKRYERIANALGYRPMRHVLNSSGIIRFPAFQMDMVRLGIGLYGIDGSGQLQGKLQTVNTLKATVSQVKKIPIGDTVGYGRMGKVTSEMRTATLSIGYADGLLRQAGNRHFSVLIRGQRAPLVGNVCMDMAMADVSHIPQVQPGDEVIIFGKNAAGEELPVQELADCLDTIPYEIFTSISGRVKRVYVQE